MDLPEENLGSATSKVRKDSTPQGGYPGIVDELNKAIEEDSTIQFA